MTRSILVGVGGCLSFAFWSVSLVGCKSSSSAPQIETARSSIERIVDPQVPAADSATLAADNALFAFAAYRQLLGRNVNLLFSPASLSIALAMAYAGAATATAAEMAQALHFTLPPAQLHPAFNALDQALAARGGGFHAADGGPMRLRLVNSLWAERTYVFRADFLDTLAANYGAGVNLVDFWNASRYRAGGRDRGGHGRRRWRAAGGPLLPR
jgi:serpin B